MRWTQEQLEAWQVTRSVADATPNVAPDPGPESVLQGKIEAWCREWGRPCLSFRQSKHAKRMLPAGWPDMEIIMPGGKTLRIELKSARGRLSDEQKQLRLQFMALGHEIYECRSYRQFLQVISIC